MHMYMQFDRPHVLEHKQKLAHKYTLTVQLPLAEKGQKTPM